MLKLFEYLSIDFNFEVFDDECQPIDEIVLFSGYEAQFLSTWDAFLCCQIGGISQWILAFQDVSGVLIINFQPTLAPSTSKYIQILQVVLSRL